MKAEVSDFLIFEEDAFDAIIFTRSLHHIHELDRALKRAKSMLKPGGKLLLEEFDLEAIDDKTARWYYDIQRILSSADLYESNLDYINDPISEWEQDHYHHGHPLHSGEQMVSAVRSWFADVQVSKNAYLYRSICAAIQDDNLRDKMAETILRIENGLIQDDHILANGLRVVAHGHGI